MKMKKFAVVLALLLSLCTASFAFASTTSATDSNRKEFTFSQDTVITEDNINDILKYYGLDPSAVCRKNERPVVPVIRDVTVRDLEAAIKMAKQLPDKIIINNDDPTNIKVITNNITTQDTGTATVSRIVVITSSLHMKHSATGRYYKSGSAKYWTSALGASIEVASDPSGIYYYQVDEIRKLINRVYNAGTSNSYLQMDYDYTVGFYMGIKDFGGIRLTSTNISGYTRFYADSIP